MPDDENEPEEIVLSVYLEKLRDALQCYDELLTSDEREVIRRKYYLEQSNSFIAIQLHTTIEKINRIESTALRKYREPHRGVDLRLFLT